MHTASSGMLAHSVFEHHTAEWTQSSRRRSNAKPQSYARGSKLDRRDVSFAITQRVGRRVDRVVAKDKIMFVRSGRAENELSIGQCFEFDRFA